MRSQGPDTDCSDELDELVALRLQSDWTDAQRARFYALADEAAEQLRSRYANDRGNRPAEPGP